VTIVVVLIVVAIVVAAAVLVATRIRGRGGLPARRQGPAAPPSTDTRHRGEPHSRREERALLREGEAIRDQVEADLQRRPRIRPRPLATDPTTAGVYPLPPPVDPAAPGYVPPPVAGAYPDPAAPGYVPPPVAGAYPDPAAPGYVPPPTGPRRRPPRPRRGLSARDQLAWQIAQERGLAYDPANPYDPVYPGGPPAVDPELLPNTSTPDALDLELQDVAAVSRLRPPLPPPVVPDGVIRRRRRLGFARPHTAFDDPPPPPPPDRVDY
jgi:hypothetical protein